MVCIFKYCPLKWPIYNLNFQQFSWTVELKQLNPTTSVCVIMQTIFDNISNATFGTQSGNLLKTRVYYKAGGPIKIPNKCVLQGIQGVPSGFIH